MGHSRPVAWFTTLILFLPLVVNSAPHTPPPAGACTHWVQVNDDGFGLPGDGAFSSEEGFEVAIFHGQLYLGMEADNDQGARLWRTRAGVTVAQSQVDWEEVAADKAGRPFSQLNRAQNDHVDSVAEFDGQLYVSTANRSGTSDGSRLFHSASGDRSTWKDALVAIDQDGDGSPELTLPSNDTAGFGDVHNGNFKDMQVFQDWLCGGTVNDATGAEVWCSRDGTTWTQKNRDGFGSARNGGIWSGAAWDGALYFGVRDPGADGEPDSADDVARLFRTRSLASTPAAWEEVFSSTPGSNRVDILGGLDGWLYISTRSPEGIVVLRSQTGGPGTWQPANRRGMNGNRDNRGTVVDGATVHEGALWVAVFNFASGFEVWRTQGVPQGDGLVDWLPVSEGGAGDANNFYAELIPFNDKLYAWTSNYASGQQVRRTACP